MNPAERLVPTYFPTKAAVAAHFQITREAVRLWYRHGIPTSKALEIERVTSGGIPALEVLRFAEKQ